MKVSFYEIRRRNIQFICTWENPVCIPVKEDTVVLELETDKSAIKRHYVVIDRIVSKDSVDIICEYDDCETIIPKPNNNE